MRASKARDDGKFKDETIPVMATRYAMRDGKRVRDDVVFTFRIRTPAPLFIT
jgi:hypothetical protein